MLYAIIAEDVANSTDQRKSARPQHLQRLEALQHAGRLVLAGPHPNIDAEATDHGFNGSLIVAEFESRDAAQTWADNDPYVTAGVYARVVVKPFLKVFPK